MTGEIAGAERRYPTGNKTPKFSRSDDIFVLSVSEGQKSVSVCVCVKCETSTGGPPLKHSLKSLSEYFHNVEL